MFVQVVKPVTFNGTKYVAGESFEVPGGSEGPTVLRRFYCAESEAELAKPENAWCRCFKVKEGSTRKKRAVKRAPTRAEPDPVSAFESDPLED